MYIYIYITLSLPLSLSLSLSLSIRALALGAGSVRPTTAYRGTSLVRNSTPLGPYRGREREAGREREGESLDLPHAT